MATLDKMGLHLWPLISATLKVSHRNSLFIHPVPVKCCLSVVAGGLLKVRSEGAVGWPVLPAPGHGRQLLVTTHGTNTASRANHAIPSVAAWRASVGFKHVPSPSWAHLLPPFPALERPLHLALPCIGLDGVSHGLAALSVPFQVDYAFDTLGCLRQPLATIHGAHAETFNLGPREGG